MAQLYVYLRINPADALKAGSTRAGCIPYALHAAEALELAGRHKELAPYLGTETDGGACRWLNASEPTVAAILEALDAAAAEKAEQDRDKAAEKAAQAERHARRVDAARTAPLADLMELRWTGMQVIEDAGRREEVEEEIARRKAAEAARQAAAAAERAEKEAAEAAERAEWIAAHGSSRLQRMDKEGIELMAAYRDERLHLERPGWQWELLVPGRYKEPRNPPESALDLLDDARETLPETERPDAKLVYWVESACDEDECDGGSGCPGNHYGYHGYAVMAEFMGRDILMMGEDEGEVE
ncbi:MAG: hypothetical protein KJN79_09415 [Gammaproteobacteria bacterium]|nr:hypothetical protein [Gammaproteobacteria bacterium]